jgi:hypothetical protein
MSLDDFQKTWQSQPAARIRVERELLLAEMRCNQRNFKCTIFWRDFREVFVAACLAVFFLVTGLRGEGWTWMLLVASCVWVGGYILVDRYRRRGQAARFGDSLSGCVEASLAEVEHQIWLLTNVFWWYLLPPFVALVAFFGEMAFDLSVPLWQRWVGFLVPTVICAAAYAFIYWINQYAVKRGLEPRRQELLAAREDLMRDEN